MARTTHGFGWIPAAEIADQLGDLKLVHGVAMSEGELKGSDQTANAVAMPRDSVVSGAGALRAFAITGAAVLDIDHYEDELPKEYGEKYGKGIMDPYPPGTILDAQAVQNTIPDGAGGETQAMQVEFLAVMANDRAYDLVKEGHVVGCSVTDISRGLDCTACETKSAKHRHDRNGARREHCACVYSGSAYVRNSLMLDLVPNSHSTWVAPLDAAGLERLKNNRDGLEKMRKKDPALAKRAEARWTKVNHAVRHYASADVAPYMNDDGYWLDGVASAADYFEKEKGMTAEQSAAVAEYVVAHPSRLSRVQLQDLSGADLLAWWTNTVAASEEQTHAAPAKTDGRIRELERRVARLAWVERATNKTGKAFHAAPLGLGEVSYGAREPGTACGTCRWFSDFGKPDDAGVMVGHCIITDSDVAGDHGCDRFEAFPGTDGGGGEGGTEEPTEPDGEAPEAPDDEEEEPMMEETVEPDKDGKCPEGYTLTEDGSMCVSDAPGDEEMDGDAPAKDAPPKKQPAPVPQGKPVIALEAAATALTAQADELDRRIEAATARAAQLRAALVNAPRIRNRHAHKDAAELERTLAEISRLHGLKKK